MVNHLPILFAITLFFHAHSQESPVRWQHRVETASTGANIYFNATIEPGWKLYGLRQDEDGPLAIAFSIRESKGVRCARPVVEVTPATRDFDKALLLNVSWHKEKAVYRMPVEITADRAVLEGEITYMACNERMCLPPLHWKFSISLPPPDNQ